MEQQLFSDHFPTSDIHMIECSADHGFDPSATDPWMMYDHSAAVVLWHAPIIIMHCYICKLNIKIKYRKGITEYKFYSQSSMSL